MEPILAFAAAASSRVDVPSKPFSPKSFNPARMSACRVCSADWVIVFLSMNSDLINRLIKVKLMLLFAGLLAPGS
jgi:hypothetical protein